MSASGMSELDYYRQGYLDACELLERELKKGVHPDTLVWILRQTVIARLGEAV